MQVFLFILHYLKKGLERVGIADTTAILVACLRQMMDTHHLPPRRDSVAEQVPSPIELSYICVNASYIAFGSYICLAASDIAHFVRSCGESGFLSFRHFVPPPSQMEAFFFGTRYGARLTS